VAINKPATQMSVHFEGGFHPASNAVDGSRKTYLSDNSCVHSLSHTNPWWMVDLGIPLTIASVHLTNRHTAGKSDFYRATQCTKKSCMLLPS